MNAITSSNVTTVSAAPAARNTAAPPPLATQQPRQAPPVAPAAVAAASQAANQAQLRQPVPSQQQARELAAEMQQRMSTVAPDLEFAVDKDSGKTLIKVIDRSTQEVVWQIPSEEMLQVTRALDRFQEGMMLRRTA